MEPKDTAQVAFLPPLYWAFGFLLALPPAFLLPLPLGLSLWVRVPLALLLAGAAAVCLAGGLRAMHRAGTAVNPFEPTTAIVTSGPYRFSRNPIYLGNTFFYLALTTALASAWPLIYLPVVIFLVQRGVVFREERYLERRFGAAYLDYKARVRRWL